MFCSDSVQIWLKETLVPDKVSRLLVLSEKCHFRQVGIFLGRSPSLFAVMFGESCHKWLVTTIKLCRFKAPPCTNLLSTEVLQNQLLPRVIVHSSHLFLGELFELPLCVQNKLYFFTFFSQFCRQIIIDKCKSFLSLLHWSILRSSHQATLLWSVF